MANEKKLDCVILGLLSHEDLTGYEIKKRMDTTLKFFWSASFGSIYPTLKELVEVGFAVKSDTAGGDRNKITYTITDKGRQHLRNWLELPVDKDELRYETLMKLFFGGETTEKITLMHIENFQSKIMGGLLYLKEMAANLERVRDDDKAHLHYLLTARFGIKVFESYLEWCEEAKSALAETMACKRFLTNIISPCRTSL